MKEKVKAQAAAFLKFMKGIRKAAMKRLNSLYRGEWAGVTKAEIRDAAARESLRGMLPPAVREESLLLEEMLVLYERQIEEVRVMMGGRAGRWASAWRRRKEARVDR